MGLSFTQRMHAGNEEEEDEKSEEAKKATGTEVI